MATDFDIVVLGSGFAGSLVAMIGTRLGFRVALLERWRHPRFAIGESSTPLANLLLESLATRYQLTRLLPFVKWGSWQRERPEVGCGLKRGFTFLHHRRGQTWNGSADRPAELLVAASPRDDIADTHWYRPDFDQFLVEEARRLGVDYLDEWEPRELGLATAGGTVTGLRRGIETTLRFRLLIDATGGSGFVARQLGMARKPFDGFPALRSLYSHFEGMPRWDAQHPTNELPPYPLDDAALHHVFADGWIWVLRFNNGITSAGVVLRDSVASAKSLAPTLESWRRVLGDYPSVEQHLAPGRPVQSFRCPGALAFRMERVVAGPCLLLPSAAGFVDPLFSTGFPLALRGIERLARVLERLGIASAIRQDELEAGLRAYERETLDDLDATAGFLGSIYRVFDDFDAFRTLSMLYFAAAIHSETARRRDGDRVDTGFLMRKDPVFGPAFRRCCGLAGNVPAEVLSSGVAQAIEPINLAGLHNPARRHWYPADAASM